MSTTEPGVYLQQDITSGLRTTPRLENDPPALRVDWISWDSGFRGTGLRPGDLIVAVNGQPVKRPATTEEAQKTGYRQVGQYGESQVWAEAGAVDGTPLSLTVRRRAFPHGWETLEVTGSVRTVRLYVNAADRSIVGAGGPDRSASDGFDGAWSYWYEEKLIPRLITVFTDGWQRQSFSNRYELEQLLADRPRIDFLLERHPGPFTDSVKADWEAAKRVLEGTPYTVTDADLEYRRAEDEKVTQVAERAKQAWTEFLKGLEADTVPPFPAVDPIHGDRAAVVGKYVVLPPVRNRDWIPEAGHNYFAVGDYGNGWYFADAESPAAFRMLRAARRYQRLVAPNLPAEYATVARILPEPRLLVMGERGVFGLQVELVAALVGDRMFVDLTRIENEESPFAGEEVFSRPSGAPPPDSAGPDEVMEALFNALRTGDQPLWRALFADWRLTWTGNGYAGVQPGWTPNLDSDWEDARRKILSRVYGLHLVWTGDPRAITRGDEFPGAPRLDQIDLEVDHVGLFDGAYRSFTDVGVHRLWQLQRLDGGPWRVASVQGI